MKIIERAFADNSLVTWHKTNREDQAYLIPVPLVELLIEVGESETERQTKIHHDRPYVKYTNPVMQLCQDALAQRATERWIRAKGANPERDYPATIEQFVEGLAPRRTGSQKQIKQGKKEFFAALDVYFLQLTEKHQDLDKQELVQRYGRPLQQLNTLATQHPKTLDVLQRITTTLANGEARSEAFEAYTNHVLTKLEEAQSACGQQLIDIN